MFFFIWLSCASLHVTIKYLFVVGVEDKEDGHPHFELHSLGEEVMDALPLLDVQVLPSPGGQDLVCKKGKTSKYYFLLWNASYGIYIKETINLLFQFIFLE